MKIFIFFCLDRYPNRYTNSEIGTCRVNKIKTSTRQEGWHTLNISYTLNICKRTRIENTMGQTAIETMEKALEAKPTTLRELINAE